MVVMATGLITVIIVGTAEVGGPSNVWTIAEKGGRLNFWKYENVLNSYLTFHAEKIVG